MSYISCLDVNSTNKSKIPPCEPILTERDDANKGFHGIQAKLDSNCEVLQMSGV